MKTLLLTAYDNNRAPLGNLTSPRMLEYANRQGFDFLCVREFDGRVGYEPYWQKIWSIANIMRRKAYDRIIWLDDDQVVTNFDFQIPWESGFHASLDWGTDAVDDSHFSMCGFVICADVAKLMVEAEKRAPEYRASPFPEQTLMRAIYKSGTPEALRMRTHPREVFNAVPKEISKEVVVPWTKDCWCAHLTHAGLEERISVFNKIVGNNK